MHWCVYGYHSTGFPIVGETQINDIAVSSQNSSVLYAAAGNQVRIWDIRKFSSTGKLSGGHQAAVMCLAVGPSPAGSDGNRVEYVVTGSKDHYVKVFEVRDGATGVLSPRWSFLALNPSVFNSIVKDPLEETQRISDTNLNSSQVECLLV